MDGNARLKAITDRLVEQMVATLVEFEVTEEELDEAISYLGEVFDQPESYLLADVLGLSIAANRLSHPDLPGVTPANVEGPLYVPGAPVRLSPVALCGADEPGTPLFVAGRVIAAADGRPLPGARLDVWQANHAGRYDGEVPERPDFNLRGRFATDAEGRYEFRTVVPGAYHIAGEGPVARLLAALGRRDWRPGHIHFKVEAEGFAPLTTQLYMPDDPWLGADAIGAVKPRLVVALSERTDPDELRAHGLDRPFRTCRFDFALTPASS